MTKEEYRAALVSLGLSQGGVAKWLDVSIRTSHGYANGEPIPGPVARALTERMENERLRTKIDALRIKGLAKAHKRKSP